MTKAKTDYAGRCPCGKVSYGSRKGAKVALRTHRGHGHPVNGMRVYRCEESGQSYFHLGHLAPTVRHGVMSREERYGEPDSA